MIINILDYQRVFILSQSILLQGISSQQKINDGGLYKSLFSEQLLMGNYQLCNGQQEKRSNSDIQAEGYNKMQGNSLKTQSKRIEIISSCPQINEKITNVIEVQKPFQPRFSSQNAKVIYKNGSSVYHGPLNDVAIQIHKKSQPQGVTRIFREDGSLEIGQFEDGKQIGQQYLFLPDGSFYFGTIEGEGIGNGSYKTQNFQYLGGFQNYQFHGFGREKHRDYDFEGEYYEGSRVTGKLSWKVNDNHFIYQGTFDQQNRFQGEGTLIAPQGTFRGNFQKGVKEGKGSFQYSNGLTFYGNYIKGIKNGEGKIVNSNGSICYEGQFKDGLPHGHGRCWDSRGQVREGDFMCGISASHYKILQSTIQS